MSAILVVEDDPRVRRSVADALRESGHEVCDVAGAAEAIACLERHSFDLLLLDYLMPETKGDAVARQVETRWPNLKIVYLTGYADFLALTGKAGGKRVIAKPVSLADLLDAVEEARGAVRALARKAAAIVDPQPFPA